MSATIVPAADTRADGGDGYARAADVTRDVGGSVLLGAQYPRANRRGKVPVGRAGMLEFGPMM